ncbi:four helix bundle protein [Chryseobacterium culicis]|uniref:four helix bundle protein n=1 Tax=Chryseobacterium culicis TaxID=680127 RepID=UPI0021CE62A4|nr:four helix bundle protein [Chryseobacterium culicis]
MNIALGSSFEFETQIIIANDLEFIQKNDFDLLMTEIRHIQNMIIKLKQNYSK